MADAVWPYLRSRVEHCINSAQDETLTQLASKGLAVMPKRIGPELETICQVTVVVPLAALDRRSAGLSAGRRISDRL